MKTDAAQKIAIVTNNLTPYRNPLFNLVKQKLNGGSLIVFYMKEKEHFRSWDVKLQEICYDYKILKGLHFKTGKLREMHFNPSLFMDLVKYSPDAVVIGGYSSISCWVALLYAKIFRRRAVLWSGSTLPSVTVDAPIVRSIRRLFIFLCDRYISYGSQAKEFIEHYGGRSDLIYKGCNVGDTDYYSQKVKASNLVNDGMVIFLFVGSLQKMKGVKELIDAFSQVKSTNWRLSIVGNGSDEDLLCEQSKNCKLDDRIKFDGFKQKEDLLDCYDKADIFVLPTHGDKFSIVTSEALAAGLFVIGSIYDGASEDIIIEGKNGFVINPFDSAAFARILERCISSKNSLPNKIDISNTVSDKMNAYASAFISATAIN
jgi:glycosyltransferase involved in cell wall biosynthesis